MIIASASQFSFQALVSTNHGSPGLLAVPGTRVPAVAAPHACLAALAAGDAARAPAAPLGPLGAQQRGAGLELLDGSVALTRAHLDTITMN